MANPFFASDSDLLPVWMDSSFGDLFELFPLDFAQESSSGVDAASCAASEGSSGVNESCSSGSTPEGEFEFPNPEDEWEHPLPIKQEVTVKTESFVAVPIKSETYTEKTENINLVMIKPDPYSTAIKPDPFPIPTTEVNLFSTDDSSELDTALALTPEHNTFIKESVEPKEEIPDIKIKRPRSIDEMDEEVAAEVVDAPEEDDPTEGFKLPASKSPIMEAMVVCALNGWGIDILKNNRATSTTPAEVVFKVTDFNRYYKISRSICSKQRPTDDLGSRIKSLRRWFVNFPKKKDRCENTFILIVKPTIAKKVNEIIDRNSRTFGLTKRRRRQ
jgi:hypothetical protein